MTNSKDEIAVTSEVGGSGMDAVGKGTQKTSVVMVSALNWDWVHKCSLFGHYAVPILSMTDLDLHSINKADKRSGCGSEHWTIVELCFSCIHGHLADCASGWCSDGCQDSMPSSLRKNILLILVGFPDCDRGAAPDHLWDWGVSPRPQDRPRGEFCAEPGYNCLQGDSGWGFF